MRKNRLNFHQILKIETKYEILKIHKFYGLDSRFCLQLDYVENGREKTIYFFISLPCISYWIQTIPGTKSAFLL